MQTFDIETYIQEKLEAKKVEYATKYNSDRADRLLHTYRYDLEDLRNHYNQKMESLQSKLDSAIKNNQDTCVIKSNGHRVDKMSKWGFVSNAALNNFLLMLSQKGYEYGVTSENRELTMCGGEKDTVVDKCITIDMKR